MDKREYLPAYLMNSQTFRDVYQINMGEVTDFHRAMDDLLEQAYIESATWGLKYWESFLGIPVDETKAAEERRSVVKSKLRGHGTATMELLKVVANAYKNGEVDILENVRNRIPPVGTPNVWSLHSNVTVEGDYRLVLNATGTDQQSIATITATPNTTYFFTGYVNHSDANYVIYCYDAQGVLCSKELPAHNPGVNTHTFITPANTARMDLILRSYAAGEFIFADFMIAQEAAGTKFRPYKPYAFTIQFIGDHGTPPNLQDLEEAIERIKPAHLEVIYEFSFLSVDKVDGMIISELQKKKLGLFAGGGDQ